MKYGIIVLLVFSCLGCRQKAGTESTPATPSGSDSSGPVAGTPMNPDTVLVRVNGTPLTQGQVELECQRILTRYASQIPAAQIETAKQRIKQDVINNFIDQTLLFTEIEKQEITATPEEIEDEINKAKSDVPAGITFEDLLRQNGLEEEMLRQIIQGKIRLNKLLAQYAESGLSVSDEELSAFIEENKSQLMRPETVRARHILIATAPEDSAELKIEKKQLAEDLRKRLLSGADFAELAKEQSSCPSRQNGGDLGLFRREHMVKPFSDAAFSQEIDAIGSVVETDFGYHIIQVMEHNAEGMAPKKDISRVVEEQKAKKAYRKAVDTLRQTATIEYPMTMGTVPPAMPDTTR